MIWLLAFLVAAGLASYWYQRYRAELSDRQRWQATAGQWRITAIAWESVAHREISAREARGDPPPARVVFPN